MSKPALLWIYIYIYISAVKVNALTQIHFNGTNFFNARLTQRVFSVTAVVGEMEMHSVANLATLQTSLAIVFPPKKHPNLVSENHRYCASARSCSPSTRTHLSLSLCVCSARAAHTLSLSLSLLLLSFCTARGREEQRFNSVKQILCCFSNLTCKYIRNHSTAIVFILCVFDFIRRRCDYHDFLCRLTSWTGELVM